MFNASPAGELLAHKTDPRFLEIIESLKLAKLRPAQEKAVMAGMLDRKSILVCTPTASGKTFVAEIACIHNFLVHHKKSIYIVPLKALATEKYKAFSQRYSSIAKVALSIGDMDAPENHLANADIIITTSEKLDSILRHRPNWIGSIGCVVLDEIHLINDSNRGPTLEIVITLLRTLIKDIQIIGLSATIGNAPALASWLSATLIVDTWRPIELKQGVYADGEIKFYKKSS